MWLTPEPNYNYYGLFRNPGPSGYWQKPPYSYIALITMAISSKPEKKMTLNQVSALYYTLGKIFLGEGAF